MTWMVLETALRQLLFQTLSAPIMLWMLLRFIFVMDLVDDFVMYFMDGKPCSLAWLLHIGCDVDIRSPSKFRMIPTLTVPQLKRTPQLKAVLRLMDRLVVNQKGSLTQADTGPDGGDRDPPDDDHHSSAPPSIDPFSADAYWRLGTWSSCLLLDAWRAGVAAWTLRIVLMLSLRMSYLQILPHKALKSFWSRCACNDPCWRPPCSGPCMFLHGVECELMQWMGKRWAGFSIV